MQQKGERSKQKLLTYAMRLFAKKPYAEVTLREIEKVTGMSHGAVMYHINNKENLFREAVELFVFRQNTLTSLPDNEDRTLKNTIAEFINVLIKEQRYWKRLGISNINRALVNVQMSCYNVIRGSLKHAGEWYEQECSIWKKEIEKAIATGEIKEVDADLLAHTIENTYLGAAYAGMPCTGGYDLKTLEKQLMLIYEGVKI